MWVIRGSLFLGIVFLQADLVVDSPKEITAEWESRVLGIRHGVIDAVGAVEEMAEGVTGVDFKKEFIGRLKEYVQKEPSGEYLEYWKNGVLKAKIPYKDGKLHGHVHGWYDNGMDAFKGFFKEGVKQGTHISFFRTEPNEHSKEIHILSYNENGLLDGKQKTCHATGNLWMVIGYENGKPNGPLECWDIKGNETVSVDYKKGHLQKNPPPPPPQRKHPKMRIDVKYVNEVIRNLEKEAENEFKIRATGSGAGMPFDVETISIKFTAVKRGTIEEARRLMVVLKERLADMVNKHEKLRPYLREYPFSPLRAEITLSFRQPDGHAYADGSVCFVTVGKGDKIHYLTENPKKPQLENFFEEPYEEAVKIVKAKGDKVCIDTSTK